ncbi:MAG: MBL fold metallo-hydrolase [Cenarchaeum sp. SB0663_bin_5]|nr:MBL fold metallo-hydrolase [Cenarchaeum sp. SB0663_bin_5]MYH03929.1 MBL fold metallo-hydrolase [Cenarchaeum sp. SB0675_bin_21]MYL11482.1 MBL fold metallo-hydrolase [Cenarchaeum sp. SB0669_bin_11]
MNINYSVYTDLSILRTGVLCIEQHHLTPYLICLGVRIPNLDVSEILQSHLPLICHEKEKDAIAKRCIVGNTIHQRTTIFADFEAILTPGHTPGSLCYLWQAPDARYLFTGDTVFFNNDR